jgi:hypothetical protein
VSETQRSSPERWVSRQSTAQLATALKRPWANPSTTHDHFALRIETAKRRHPCRRIVINLSAKLEHIKANSSQQYDCSEDAREPTTHFPVALIAVSLKIKHFHFGFSMQKQ